MKAVTWLNGTGALQGLSGPLSTGEQGGRVGDKSRRFAGCRELVAQRTLGWRAAQLRVAAATGLVLSDGPFGLVYGCSGTFTWGGGRRLCTQPKGS